MASKAATKPLHVLRGLLRNLKTDLPEGSQGSTAPSMNNNASKPTRQFLLRQYRASLAITDPEETARLRKLASDYLSLQNDLREREKLYELDTGAETVLSPKEMSRRAAARAGLQLPDLNPDLEK